MIKIGLKLPAAPDTGVDRRAWLCKAAELFQELYKDKLMFILFSEDGPPGKLIYNMHMPNAEEKR